METNKTILLSPNWNAIGVVKYRINRMDHFRFHEKTRYPIDNSYELHLRLIKSKEKKLILEAFYPQGILKLLTCFQAFSSFIGMESDYTKSEGDAFNYIINKKGKLKRIKNSKAIRNYIARTKDLLAKEILRDDIYKRQLSDLDIIAEVNDRNEYLIRDLEIIHQYGGLEIPTIADCDLSSEMQEETEEDVNNLKPEELEFLSKFNLDIGGVSLLRARGSDKKLTIDHLGGLNLYSVEEEEWNDFKEIRKSFFKGSFDIDHYNNITLHQKKFEFDCRDKLLNYYLNVRKTVNPNMEKITKVEIQKIN